MHSFMLSETGIGERSSPQTAKRQTQASPEGKANRQATELGPGLENERRHTYCVPRILRVQDEEKAFHQQHHTAQGGQEPHKPVAQLVLLYAEGGKTV